MLVTAALTLLVTGCATGGPESAPPVERLGTQVLAEIPHDTTAATQGLEISGSTLLEGTGVAGASRLRELDPAGGEVLRSAPLPDGASGQGITVVDGPDGRRVWQLTWQDGVAYEWDLDTLTVVQEVPVDGEGWGLCADGDRLLRSDGTSRLRFHDPVTFAETGGVDVTLNGTPVENLNELECVDGQVWANVYPSDEIVRIDPSDGAVTGIVEASGLLSIRVRNDSGILNGIAHVGDGEFLITGRQWPTTFRVRFAPV